MHFSDLHVAMFMKRANHFPDGTIEMIIGDGDEHIPEVAKESLAHSFLEVTQIVLDTVRKWISKRDKYSNATEEKMIKDWIASFKAKLAASAAAIKP